MAAERYLLPFLLMIDLINCGVQTKIDVSISQRDGRDGSECLQGLHSCGSFSFVLNAIGQSKMAEIAVITLSEDYSFHNETLAVYSPKSNLNQLILRSSNGKKVKIEMFNTSFTIVNKQLEKPSNLVITIEGIQFQNSIHHSALLSFHNLKEVSIISCEFVNNMNASVMVSDTNLNVNNCKFYGKHDNSSLPEEDSLRRGIFVSYSQPKQQNVIINHSVFENVYATLPTNEQLFSPRDSLRSAGAGMLILLTGNAISTSVAIDNCTFINNQAMYGGGIAIICEEQSRLGEFIVKNSLFSRCQGGVSGGSILFASIGYYNRNHTMTLNLCRFEHSNSSSGGTVRLVLYNDEFPIYLERQSFTTPLLIVMSCLFDNNTASQGAAIHATCLSTFDNCGSKYAVHLENTTISNQRRIPTKNGMMEPLAAALFFEMMHCIFKSNVTISNSTFLSGIVLVNAHIHLNGRLVLYNNFVDSKGGGIVLSGFSHLVISRNSHVRIEKNHAWVYGGGVFATSLGMMTAHMTNPRCFILFEADKVLDSKQSNFKTNVRGILNLVQFLASCCDTDAFHNKLFMLHPQKQIEFIDNSAAVAGGAIFVDTLRHCGSSLDFPFTDLSQALRWLNRTISFSGNYIGNHGTKSNFTYIKYEDLTPAEVSTFTDRFNMSTHEVHAPPEMDVDIEIKAFDEINFQSYSSSVMYLTNGDRLVHSNSSIYLQDNRLVMKPKSSVGSTLFHYNLRPNSTIDDATHEKYTVSILDDRAPNQPLKSFVLHPTNCFAGYIFDKATQSCTCDIDNQAILRCQKKSVFLKPWYWANVSTDGRFLTYNCHSGHCQCRKEEFSSGCEFDAEHPNDQCADGYHGTLCGGCKPGYAIQLYYMECVPCNDTTKGKILFSLWIFVFTVICFLIIVFNPGFPPMMRGVVFFCQMIHYVYLVGSNDKPGSVLVHILNLATLEGTAPLGCISKSLDATKGQLLIYTFPALCFAVLGATFIGNKYYLLNFKRRETPFQSIWILILFIYTNICEDALVSFDCVNIDGSLVFFYDGTQKCFEGYHLVGVLLSVVYIAIFIIPVPVFVFLISTRRARTVPYIVDAITKGYRSECRWWWTYEFIRRIVFVCVFVFCPISKLKEMLLSLSAFVCCIFHVAWQPYKQQLANITETILLAIFFLLSFLRSTTSLKTLSLVLLSLATFLIFIICAYGIITSIREKCVKTDRDDSLVEENASDFSNYSPPSTRNVAKIPHPKRLDDREDEYV